MQEREVVKKIALIGTSSVGKTETFESYRNRFGNDPRVTFVEEAARRYFKDHPEIVDRFAKEPQGEIQKLALSDEQEAHGSDAKIIFCDRSVIDAVAYVRAHGNKNGSEELFERVAFWLPTYDKFLLLDPSDVPFVNDEERKEKEEERNNIHSAFLELFSEKQIPYELLSGTREERYRRIDEILEVK
jgi:nicotinamide riboside kinase